MATVDSAAYCSRLMAGLADAGVTLAIVSPGSRNTPLTLAAIAEPRIRDINIRDERSAGFVALGHAKTTKVPAIVICTSGSAGTHYYPAVVEADQSAAPMIVLTSDRPLRLRGSGAPQTMDQRGLYGDHVKRSLDLTLDEQARDVAIGLYNTAVEGVPGPVHANVPFDEPLLPDRRVDRVAAEPEPSERTAWDGPTDLLSGLGERKVMFVASGSQTYGFGEALATAAERLDAPVLADAQITIDSPNVIQGSDLVVGSGAMALAPPDVVVRLGPLPTAKAVWRWLEGSGAEQLLVYSSRLRDPLGSASTTIEADPKAFLINNHAPTRGSTSFADTWRRIGAHADEAVDRVLLASPFPNEPEIARTLTRAVPPGSVLFMASSMPIRDIDVFGVRRNDVTPLANRGVNGIDGTISSAMGAALSGMPTTLLIGDIAALHDATALSEAARLGVPLRIVVVNNDGGGIFSFLPQASSNLLDDDAYERHWGTPHGLSIAEIARSMKVPARSIDALDDFTIAVTTPITGPEVIELATDRDTNVAIHHEIRTAVEASLEI
jgi:2-succinyl-5-enolpyruvyl-6-hydroxy-3-cyclohexene-1-carboxylate synthase